LRERSRRAEVEEAVAEGSGPGGLKMAGGLTRDGTFLIENGKITKALKNFRWNESPLFMLNKLEEFGRAERTAAGQVMPSIRVKDFNLTSPSDAV
jgi:predicted Zn-dependent protease